MADTISIQEAARGTIRRILQDIAAARATMDDCDSEGVYNACGDRIRALLPQLAELARLLPETPPRSPIC